MMVIDEIRALAAMAREAGIRRVRAGDVEIEMGDPPAAAGASVHPRRRIPTAEDFLFWSTSEQISTEKSDAPGPVGHPAPQAP